MLKKEESRNAKCSDVEQTIMILKGQLEEARRNE
jgi:hypothetical protein